MSENLEIVQVQVNGPLPKRGGEQTGVPERKPNNQSENQYHILEVKIHPHSLKLVISSLGQNVSALTH